MLVVVCPSKMRKPDGELLRCLQSVMKRSRGTPIPDFVRYVAPDSPEAIPLLVRAQLERGAVNSDMLRLFVRAEMSADPVRWRDLLYRSFCEDPLLPVVPGVFDFIMRRADLSALALANVMHRRAGLLVFDFLGNLGKSGGEIWGRCPYF